MRSLRLPDLHYGACALPFRPLCTALCSRQHREQTKMIDKGSEITIREEQRHASFDTERRDIILDTEIYVRRVWHKREDWARV
jgi:hypothetical protein